MNHSILASFQFLAGTRFAQPKPRPAEQVTLDAPGQSVMTDLSLVRAATVGPNETLLIAREHMIHQGVRLLFVVREMPCVDGLITSTDLEGERPLQVIHRRGVRYDDLVVADVMSPLAQVDAIAMEDLAHANVGKVVATLQHLGRRHMLVVEQGRGGQPPQLRGVISQTQIERQIGRSIDLVEHAHNFAELSASLK